MHIHFKRVVQTIVLGRTGVRHTCHEHLAQWQNDTIIVFEMTRETGVGVSFCAHLMCISIDHVGRMNDLVWELNEYERLWTWHVGYKNTTFDNPRSCRGMCLNTRNETKGKDLANTEVSCKHASLVARKNTFPKNVGKYYWQTQNVLRNVTSSIKEHSTLPTSDVSYACFLGCTLNAHTHTPHHTHTYSYAMSEGTT